MTDISDRIEYLPDIQESIGGRCRH